MAGHVFVAKGDLRKLACDAWLLPCDYRASPGRTWTEALPGLPDSFRWPPAPPGWSQEAVRAFEVDTWPSNAPTPWLVNVGGYKGKEIAWYVHGAREFLDRASAAAKRRGARNDRATPLLALPLVGTAGGGAGREAGDVVRELLPCLRDTTIGHDVDVVLVAKDEAAFAAAQAERARGGTQTWLSLSPELQSEARRLAGHAASGNLVLFLGAGIGKGAGLPLLDELIEQLAGQADMSPAERKEFSLLDTLDRASVLARRLKAGSLGQATAKLLQSFTHSSLSHALIASLPVKEVVTTNYDRLFEQASEAAGFPVRVLPEPGGPHDRRWLLKMHGCVSAPDQIVLTREDYLRYEEHRAALTSIVQALLITKHMLFVGFGLQDDNFHRIADAVRKALRPLPTERTSSEPFGTVLMLVRNALQQELWDRDLRWVVLGSAPEELPGKTQADSARQLEIFLDCLLSRTSSTAYFLDPSYATLLSDGEKTLASTLRQLAESTSADAKQNPVWLQVDALLRSLGARSPGSATMDLRHRGG